jgi:hypothetical protein
MVKMDFLTRLFLDAKKNGFDQKQGRFRINTDNNQIVKDNIAISPDTLFFNHSFLQAIFGDKWQYHLLELAKTQQRFKYLKKHIIQKDDNGTKK